MQLDELGVLREERRYVFFRAGHYMAFHLHRQLGCEGRDGAYYRSISLIADFKKTSPPSPVGPTSFFLRKGVALTSCRLVKFVTSAPPPPLPPSTGSSVPATVLRRSSVGTLDTVSKRDSPG